MALDPKELKQLVALIGETLAPHIRESVAENVAVRLDVLRGTMEEQFAKRLEETRASVEAEFANRVDTLLEQSKALHEEVKQLSFVAPAALEEAVAALDDRISRHQTQLAETFPLYAGRSDVQALSEEVAEVRGLIPVVPKPIEPEPLVVKGELHPAMREAMELAMRHMVLPSIRSSVDAVEGRFREETSKLGTQLSVQATEIERNSASLAEVPVLLGGASEVIRKELTEALGRVSSVTSALSSRVDNLDTKFFEALEKSRDGLQTQITSVSLGISAVTSDLRSEVKDCIASFDKQLAEATSDFITTGDLKKASAELAVLVNSTVKQIGEVSDKFQKELAALSATVDSNVSELRGVSEAIDAEQTKLTARLLGFESEVSDVAQGVSSNKEATQSVSDQVSSVLKQLGVANERVDALYVHAENNAKSVEVVAAAQKQIVSEFDAKLDGSIVGIHKLVSELRTASEQREVILSETKELLLGHVESINKAFGPSINEHIPSLKATVSEAMARIDTLAEQLNKNYEDLSASLAENTESIFSAHKDLKGLEQKVSENEKEASSEILEVLSVVNASSSETTKELTKIQDYLVASEATFKAFVEKTELGMGALDGNMLEQIQFVRSEIETVRKNVDSEVARVEKAIAEVSTMVAKATTEHAEATERILGKVRQSSEATLETANSHAIANITKMVAGLTPAIVESAVASSLEAVPSAVDKSVASMQLQATLQAALEPKIIDLATSVATGACEPVRSESKSLADAAIEAAKASAEEYVDAKVDLLKSVLDPAPLVGPLVEEAVKSLPTMVEKAVAEEISVVEPRLSVQLTSKLQSEVDRIPRPRDGKDGKDGKDGEHGRHGKDARIQTPVAYEIGKVYEHGSWVAHNGGVWVSTRSTEDEPTPESYDWDCVTAGITAIETRLATDGRTMEVHYRLANGEFHKGSVRLPIPVVRGLYEDGKEYSEDDVVTYGGSWWEALKSGKLARPGTDDSWKLSIKRGQDGKDLKQPPPPIIRYAGPWEDGKLYEANQIVEHAGVRWLAMRSTRERPPFMKLVSNDTWTKLGA